ncbi:MAG: hypothetical protein SAK29_34895 [Scytonema sp. PMC 1069.18]|nr:hypothetical protein [Scytonema sp. PMC 1069.18]MEC4886040.1 hypothetical protein [Scytonema sp. PMC 1070.18]
MDYPVSDPSWDYATIYHKAQLSRQHLSEAIALLIWSKYISGVRMKCDRNFWSSGE